MSDDEIPGGAWALTPDTRQTLRRASIDEALRVHDLDRAAIELEELLDEVPDEPDALRLLAAVETERHDVLTARQVWESVVRQAAHDPTALVQLAQARFECADLDGAAEAALAATRVDPLQAEAWYMLALVGERTGVDAEQVHRHHVRAFALHPTACPLPIVVDEPRRLVRRALRQCSDAVRAFWRQVPLTIQPFPDPIELQTAVPPLSPRIVAAYAGSPDEDDVPEALRVYPGNLRHFESVDHAEAALVDALESEAWSWIGEPEG